MQLSKELLAREVLGLVRKAGQKILEIRDSGLGTEYKSDGSPVTAADLAANEILVGGLRELTPETAVVSEELPIPTVEGRHWLVDPLDGTKDFLRGSSEFTVNAALIEGGRPVLGAVYAPALATCYLARTDGGAHRITDDETWLRLWLPDQDAAAPEQWRVLASRSHRSPGLSDLLERLGNYRLLSAGSSLKFGLVAEGSADLYARYSPTSHWDTAAGQCILELAGGTVIDLEGQRLTYGSSDDVLNPSFVAMPVSRQVQIASLLVD